MLDYPQVKTTMGCDTGQGRFPRSPFRAPRRLSTTQPATVKSGCLAQTDKDSITVAASLAPSPLEFRVRADASGSPIDEAINGSGTRTRSPVGLNWIIEHDRVEYLRPRSGCISRRSTLGQHRLSLVVMLCSALLLRSRPSLPPATPPSSRPTSHDGPGCPPGSLVLSASSR